MAFLLVSFCLLIVSDLFSYCVLIIFLWLSFHFYTVCNASASSLDLLIIRLMKSLSLDLTII